MRTIYSTAGPAPRRRLERRGEEIEVDRGRDAGRTETGGGRVGKAAERGRDGQKVAGAEERRGQAVCTDKGRGGCQSVPAK